MSTLFETDGALAILTFNRPEARNAMTWEMYDALVEACERVDRDAAVRELASEIAANAPLTIRATKELIRRVAAKRRLAAGEDADMVELCYTSADFREGVAAFLEKRKPRWTGK